MMLIIMMMSPDELFMFLSDCFLLLIAEGDFTGKGDVLKDVVFKVD